MHSRRYVRISGIVSSATHASGRDALTQVRVPLWILHRVACTKLAQAFTFCSLSRSGCISKLMLMPFGMNRPNKIRRRFLLPDRRRKTLCSTPSRAACRPSASADWVRAKKNPVSEIRYGIFLFCFLLPPPCVDLSGKVSYSIFRQKNSNQTSTR